MKHTLHLAHFDSVNLAEPLTKVLATDKMFASSIELIETPTEICLLAFEKENQDPWSFVQEKPKNVYLWEVDEELRNAFYGLTQNRFKKYSYRVTSDEVAGILSAAVKALEQNFTIVELSVRRNAPEHFLYITSEDHTHLPLFQKCECVLFHPSVA
jgi:hypothetical protein